MAFKIGVIADSFRVSIKEALKKASIVGADGIQFYATKGEMAPENLSASQRKEFLRMLDGYGLKISAICGDLGGHGFINEDDNKWKIEKSKRIMDLARELGTNVVTTHIGVVPEDNNNPRWEVMRNACQILAEYGDNVGAYFAIETGPERAAVLKQFLDSLDSKGVRVNMDPANLVMVTGDDPVEAVHTLKDYIVHTHAKDGIMLCKKNPEVIYGLLEDDNKGTPAFKEVPLGTGSVDFPEYLKALNFIGFNGYLTIEREVGDDPGKDIKLAVDFLKKTIKEADLEG